MALLSMPKIGSWKLDDLVNDPTEKEFQDFLESITTKVEQLERKRGEPLVVLSDDDADCESSE